jgi:hypothetical protein
VVRAPRYALAQGLGLLDEHKSLSLGLLDGQTRRQYSPVTWLVSSSPAAYRSSCSRTTR